MKCLVCNSPYQSQLMKGMSVSQYGALWSDYTKSRITQIRLMYICISKKARGGFGLKTQPYSLQSQALSGKQKYNNALCSYNARVAPYHPVEQPVHIYLEGYTILGADPPRKIPIKNATRWGLENAMLRIPWAITNDGFPFNTWYIHVGVMFRLAASLFNGRPEKASSGVNIQARGPLRDSSPVLLCLPSQIILKNFATARRYMKDQMDK